MHRHLLGHELLLEQRVHDHRAGAGVDRRLGWHAVGLEQQRRDAELGQHGAVGAGVLGRLEGHALQRGGRGHRRHGEVEALQVLLQAVREGVLVDREATVDHHFALATIFEIMDVASRADLKADLLKDLDRQKQQCIGYRGNPSISEGALDEVVAKIDHAFNGLNDVELYVVDEFGRRLIAAFSQFFSARLLNPGIAEFGATLGLRVSPEEEMEGLDVTQHGERVH